MISICERFYYAKAVRTLVLFHARVIVRSMFDVGNFDRRAQSKKNDDAGRITLPSNWLHLRYVGRWR